MNTLIALLFLSIFSSTSLADSIWDQPSVWQLAKQKKVSVRDLPALTNSGLSEDAQALLLQQCVKQGHETRTFKLQQRYRITQVSDIEQLEANCDGRLGQTSCNEDSFRIYIAECVNERIANARVESAFKAL